MDFVSDTNVWYDIGSGIIDPSKLKQGGSNRLLAPAINALEISSKLTDHTLVDRKKAAQAILDHADELLKDPERHMADIWGLTVTDLKFDWKDVYRTIAASSDINEMNSGAQKIMKVNTAAAQKWREGFTQQFVDDVETAIRTIAPKYAAKRMTGKMHFLKEPAQLALLKSVVTAADTQEGQILLTRTRASDHAPSPITQPPSQAEIDAATPQLLPFVKAYLTFMDKVATERAAHPNDWGDLHCFVYLQGNRKLLTGEDKWIALANDAGLGHLVQDSKTV